MTTPIRILHAFGRMGRGGAETWLMNVLRRIDRERFHFDFLVHRRRPGEFDDEIRSLGCTIHVVESHRHPTRYALELGKILGRGRYDIVHSHVSHYSGYILLVAAAMGIAGRIAHHHTAVPTASDSLMRRAYKQTMRAAIHAACTRGLGASAMACESLYGPRWRAHDKYQVLLYGYDFSRFARINAATRAACRAELGLGQDDLVIGHIGRFVVPKNHWFIVDLIAASQARGRDDQRFVLVGEGELWPAIDEAIRERGVGHKVVLTGQRSDIPELMSAFDVLILPSLWEGFGVTLLEAQAAGLGCIVSDRVPPEATVMSELVLTLPVDRVDQQADGQVARHAGAHAVHVNAWLDALDAMRARPAVPPAQALMRLRASDFDIDRHVAAVEQIYTEEARRGRGSRSSSLPSL